MKKIFFANTKFFMTNIFAKTTLLVLLVLAFQTLCFGQVYSYTDASASETTVYGYGAVTGTYNSNTHVYQTTTTISAPSGRSTTASSSGSSVSASLSIESDSGNFSVNTFHVGTCPYQGQTHPLGGSGRSFLVPSKCELCQTQRSFKRLACYGLAGGCELLALANYNNAINACENNTFCQEGNANYNPEECGRCRDGAQTTLGIATGACGLALAFCLETALPDCSGEATADGSNCINN